MTSHILFCLFLVASFMVSRLEGTTGTCGWEERSNIALEKLLTPAMVLREYSDVTSAYDCYRKCCDLEAEHCNVAAFMTYESEVICMNVRCEPFEKCIWGPYPTSIAAIIGRSSNTRNNTFASVTLSGGKTPNATHAARPVPTTAPSVNTSIEHVTDQRNVTSGGALPTDHEAYTTMAPPADNRAESTQKPVKPNYNPDVGTNDEGVNKDKVATDSNSSPDGGDLDSSNFGGPSNNTMYVGGARHQVNYTVSITIGVLTCVAFLTVMYVAARRFHLFQDRSKYSRLLENPEQYADNYSASEFED